MPRAISAVMTRDVTVVSPEDNVQRAAQVMAAWNVGVLPVCDGKRLVGVLTDRDIAVRAAAAGKAPDAVRVAEVMSGVVRWCFDDQNVGEALQLMSDEQVRRIPVVDRNNMELVGIITLGDIAVRTRANVEDALEEISFPSEPVRQTPRAAAGCQVAGD